MSALIEEFKSEHLEIIGALKQVKEIGILTKEGQAKLMSIKATLLEHLDEEDERFYPILLKEADQNNKLKEILEVFAKDLDGVSKFVFGFFDRYDKGLLGERLLGDFETLYMIIRNRMENEENILYDEYEKISS